MTFSVHTWRRRGVVTLLMVAALAVPAVPASAGSPSRPRTDVIVLPGATSAEGIAAGEGSTFFAGEIDSGDIFRGDVRRGTAAPFIDAPEGRGALGMAVDTRRDLLFVAGGFTGQAYIYDTDTGAPVADYQFGAPGSSIVNDVALTRAGAWFTDSVAPKLYFVPIDRRGVPGPFRTLDLTGPAAALTGDFNLNGIQATRDGRTLIVAHSANAALYTVDPRTGASADIAGISLPNVDGIVLAGNRLWAVQNQSNQITRIRLRGDLTSGTVQKVITSDAFQVPTTAARFGGTLAVVNAKFGVTPPPTQYEVVLVDA